MTYQKQSGILIHRRSRTRAVMLRSLCNLNLGLRFRFHQLRHQIQG